MATATLVDSGMTMTFDAGVDGEGNPVTKRKSFRNVKTLATHDQLYNIAQALAPLQQFPVVLVERDNSFEISA